MRCAKSISENAWPFSPSRFLQEETSAPSDSTSYNTVAPSEYPPARRLLLEAVEKLRRLGPNWNGDAADPPTENALRMCEAFIRHIPLNREHPDEIWPDGDGAVCMEWSYGTQTLNVIIDGFFLHFLKEDGGVALARMDNRPYFLSYLDEDIRDLIPFNNLGQKTKT